MLLGFPTRVLALMGLVTTAGCLAPQAQLCGSVLCAPQLVCAPTGGCVLPLQLESCNGKANSDPCVFAAVNGVCVDGVCLEHFCGDGVVQPPEQCEGTNLDGKDCQAAGFYRGTLACHPDTCRFDTSGCADFCGDQVLNGAELCDGPPPPELSCLTFGYDSGYLDCNPTLCTPVMTSCRFLGWQPTTTATDETAVWGSADDDVFAVGANGTISHFDGTRWSAMASPTAVPLTAVWGRARDDVYAVGQDTILHYDGAAWTVVPAGVTGELFGIWGAPGVVYVVGGNGIWRGSGSTFALETTPGSVPFFSIWGSSPSDIYVGGSGGLLLHFDGTSWSSSAVGLGNIVSIWGTGPDDLFVANRSDRFEVWHRDRNGWTPPLLSLTEKQGKLWGIASDAVFLVTADQGWFFDGNTWTALPFPAGASMTGIWSNRLTNLHVVGRNQRFRSTGGLTTHLPLFFNAVSFAPTAIWGTASDNLYVVAGSGIRIHFDGTNWISAPFLTTADLAAVWGADANTVFAVGQGGRIAQLAAGVWTLQGGSVTEDLAAVWGTSASNVFAVGANGTILH